VTEVYFGSTKFSWKGQAVLAQFDPGSLAGVGGYATTDGFQHVLVTGLDGVVSELRWRPDLGFQTGP
jgi:hypothetical protein